MAFSDYPINFKKSDSRKKGSDDLWLIYAKNKTVVSIFQIQFK